MAKTILHIEDNLANRKIVRDLLSLRGKYKVLEASNGEEGLKLIQAKKPDLVLIDIQLPVIDGLSVTRAIRQDENVSIRKIPIIIITSYAMSGDREKGFAAGCDAYLVKPLNLNKLLETINKLFKNKKEKFK